ncbi:MAG: hypothetical protein DLM64_08980 [Solirubrobacterales bacterium]|nr:MAG: hypothetical protein DLM64_08980 [Solirubrobacterales bacterium]
MLAVVACAASGATAKTAPRLSLIALAPGNIRVHDGGQLAIGVLCRANSSACAGRVLISPLHSSPHSAPLAAVNIRLRSGRESVVAIALTRAGRRALARQHRLRVRIIIHARDEAHRLAALSAKRTLVPGSAVGCWPRFVPGQAFSLANSPTARGFTYLNGSVGDPSTDGCLYRLDDAFRLDNPPETAVDVPIKFADPYVATVLDGGSVITQNPPPFYDVASWDLRTGRRVHLDRLTIGGEDEVSLVVSPTDGAIACISGFEGPDPSDIVIVGADDADGYRTLDTSNGINIASLAISGNIVSWTDNGQTRTATLR